MYTNWLDQSTIPLLFQIECAVRFIFRFKLNTLTDLTKVRWFRFRFKLDALTDLSEFRILFQKICANWFDQSQIRLQNLIWWTYWLDHKSNSSSVYCLDALIDSTKAVSFCVLIECAIWLEQVRFVLHCLDQKSNRFASHLKFRYCVTRSTTVIKLQLI